MARDYPRLSIEEFGAHLLDTGDLDPIYIALSDTDWDGLPLGEGHWGGLAQRDRWLVAYWCFYHAGVACHMSELQGRAFWTEMERAAVNEEPTPTGTRWPRGHERRHARGAQGIAMVAHLAERYPLPEAMPNYLQGDDDATELDFAAVSNRAQEHRLFGPWIGFKVADMIDRCIGAKVNFDQAAVFMFKDPRQAALKLWRQRAGVPDTAKPRDETAAITSVVDYLTDHFQLCMAPPAYDRPVGLQEVETVLCKWKSHMNGHYPLYNDIDEIRDGLTPWADHSPTAKAFLGAMPLRGRPS